MCGFCNVWVCVCVGFVMCGCVCVCWFSNLWVCVCVGVLVIRVLVFTVLYCLYCVFVLFRLRIFTLNLPGRKGLED